MGETRLFTLEGARRRHPEVQAWFSRSLPPHIPLAGRWFDVIRACGPDVQEIMHDGQPTACVATAAFAYVGVYKAHVNVGFFDGGNLADPKGLLEGAGRFMRHVKVRPGQPFDEAALEELIRAAYRDMKKLVAAAARR